MLVENVIHLFCRQIRGQHAVGTGILGGNGGFVAREPVGRQRTAVGGVLEFVLANIRIIDGKEPPTPYCAGACVKPAGRITIREHDRRIGMRIPLPVLFLSASQFQNVPTSRHRHLHDDQRISRSLAQRYAVAWMILDHLLACGGILFVFPYQIQPGAVFIHRADDKVTLLERADCRFVHRWHQLVPLGVPGLAFAKLTSQHRPLGDNLQLDVRFVPESHPFHHARLIPSNDVAARCGILRIGQKSVIRSDTCIRDAIRRFRDRHSTQPGNPLGVQPTVQQLTAGIFWIQHRPDPNHGLALFVTVRSHMPDIF